MGKVEIIRAEQGGNWLSSLLKPKLQNTCLSQQLRQPGGSKKSKLILTAVAMLLVTSLSCDFVTGLLNGSNHGAISGPIIGMAAGSSVDQQGQAVDPKFTFDPSEPQIAVVVQVGKLDNLGPLTITWYQITDEGDQKLFADTVEVSPFDQAFSIGKNPGLLAEGNYKIVASLNGQLQSIEIAVAQPSTSQSQAQAQGAITASATTAQGQPPVSGGSGSVPQSANAPESLVGSGSDCNFSVGSLDAGGVDNNAPYVEFYMYSHACTGHIEIDVAIDGGPITPYDTMPYPDNENYGPWGFGTLDPCDPKYQFPFDLPKTSVKIIAKVLDGPGAGMSKEADLRLGDDTLAPEISKVSSDPKPNSRVKSGDKITITFTAEDSESTGVWQTGLQDIQITDKPGNTVYTKEFGSKPKVCKDKTQQFSDSYVYTVPKDAPPVINLCILAEDYVPNVTKKCAAFYTGDHWTGTMRTTISATYAGGSCTNGQYLSNLDLYVAADGTVAGTGTGHVVTPAQCVFVSVKDIGQATQLAFALNGTFDGKTFSLAPTQTYMDTEHSKDFIEWLFDSPDNSPRIKFSLTGQGSAGGLVEFSFTPASIGSLVITGEQLIDIKCQDCQPGVGMNFGVPGSTNGVYQDN